MLTIENNGEKFIEEKLLAGQKRLAECVRKIAQEIRPGMNEKQGTEITQKVLLQNRFGKNWHPHKVRFGPNTVKTYSEISDTSVVLQENDIFFLDLGPLLEDHECDYGETFVIGDDTELKNLADTAKTIFTRVKEKWLSERLSGVDLYNFAVEETKKEGFDFITKGASGHRIGDFPHQVHYKGNLLDIKENPHPNRWILEIQLHNKSLNRGAFFEDIL